jgi:hypothetical protein
MRSYQHNVAYIVGTDMFGAGVQRIDLRIVRVGRTPDVIDTVAREQVRQWLSGRRCGFFFVEKDRKHEWSPWFHCAEKTSLAVLQCSIAAMKTT